MFFFFSISYAIENNTNYTHVLKLQNISVLNLEYSFV